MSRVAVITDIHANLPALEATLAEIERLGVDAVYCGGDLVGYGPHPNEVCALIEARAIPTTYGPKASATRKWDAARLVVAMAETEAARKAHPCTWCNHARLWPSHELLPTHGI